MQWRKLLFIHTLSDDCDNLCQLSLERLENVFCKSSSSGAVDFNNFTHSGVEPIFFSERLRHKLKHLLPTPTQNNRL